MRDTAGSGARSHSFLRPALVDRRTLMIGLVPVVLGSAVRAEQAGEGHEIREWLELHDAALNRLEWNTLEQFYEPDVTVFVDNKAFSDWAEYLEHGLKATPGGDVRSVFKRSVLHVHVLGTATGLAYVAGRVELSVHDGAESTRKSGFETLVIKRAGGNPWRVQHRHVAFVPGV